MDKSNIMMVSGDDAMLQNKESTQFAKNLESDTPQINAEIGGLFVTQFRINPSALSAAEDQNKESQNLVCINQGDQNVSWDRQIL